MSLRDLKPAAYKSPSGQVVKFSYEDLESSVDLKAAVFESAIGSGTYVQPNGHTSGRFPMACFFHGDDYDLKAEAFLSALLESGQGVLTHPVYDEINVVPTGSVTRIDALKTASNQVVYAVTFYETTGLQIGESGGLDQAFDDLVQASSLDFSEKVALDDPVDKEGFKNRVQATMDTISATMKRASGGVSKVNDAIEDTGDSLSRGMDTLLGEPLNLARQCQLLIGEPRRQNSMVNAKLSAYQNLANDIFSGTVEEPSKYNKEAENTFHLNRMSAQAMIGNMAMVAATSKEFLLRREYLAAADLLSSMLDQYQTWHDDSFATLALDTVEAENSDTGDGLAELGEVVAGAMSTLIHGALSAQTEMKIKLTRDEAVIPLCFRLMGSGVDPTLDRFIEINHLETDEILTIPKGREIVWHV